MNPLCHKTVHAGVAVCLMISIDLLASSSSMAQERGQPCIEKQLVCVERRLSTDGVWVCKKHEWRCTRWGKKPKMGTEPDKGSTVLPLEGARKLDRADTQPGSGPVTQPQ